MLALQELGDRPFMPASVFLLRKFVLVFFQPLNGLQNLFRHILLPLAQQFIDRLAVFQDTLFDNGFLFFCRLDFALELLQKGSVVLLHGNGEIQDIAEILE